LAEEDSLPPATQDQAFALWPLQWASLCRLECGRLRKLKGCRTAFPVQGQLHCGLISRAKQRMPEITHVEHLMLVDCRDNIAVLESAEPRRLCGVDLQGQHAAVAFEAKARDDGGGDGARHGSAAGAVDGSGKKKGLAVGLSGFRCEDITVRMC